MMESNQEQQIQKLKYGRGIFNFMGKEVTKIIGGYMLFGNKYSTEIEVLDAIKKAEGYLEGSITVTNANGAFSSQNYVDGDIYPK